MTRSVKDIVGRAAARDSFWEQWPVGDFIDSLTRRMDELQISRTALAHKLGFSPAYVTQVLRGDGNLTVQTMAKLARAVDSVVRVHLSPAGASVQWVTTFSGSPAVQSANQRIDLRFGDNRYSAQPMFGASRGMRAGVTNA